MFSPRFLMLILGKFAETFNANAVKRFVLDLYLANSVYINHADKAFYAVESLPRKFALRTILRDALLSYLPPLVSHVEKHVHVYSGSAIRGDGHFKVASRILPQEKINVIYAWIGIDGALLRPPAAMAGETWPDIRPHLEELVADIISHRKEAGLPGKACCPAFHATDSYSKHRLKLGSLYTRSLPVGLRPVSSTPKGPAQSIEVGAEECPTLCLGRHCCPSFFVVLRVLFLFSTMFPVHQDHWRSSSWLLCLATHRLYQICWCGTFPRRPQGPDGAVKSTASSKPIICPVGREGAGVAWGRCWKLSDFSLHRPRITIFPVFATLILQMLCAVGRKARFGEDCPARTLCSSQVFFKLFAKDPGISPATLCFWSKHLAGCVRKSTPACSGIGLSPQLACRQGGFQRDHSRASSNATAWYHAALELPMQKGIQDGSSANFAMVVSACAPGSSLSQANLQRWSEEVLGPPKYRSY